jgi:competence protein ComEA
MTRRVLLTLLFATPIASVLAQAESAPRKYKPNPNKLRAGDKRRVNLNKADSKELQRVLGIGPVLAGRIIALRKKKGQFRKPEELIEVSGIGPKTFARMRPFLTL